MELESLNLKQAKINQFNAAGIYSIEDLIKYIPKKYYDFRQPQYVRELADGEISAVVGTVYAHSIRPKFVSIKIKDEKGEFITAYLFGRKYVPAEDGDGIIVCGTVKINTEYHNTVIYPIFFSKRIGLYKRIVPVYKKVKGMSDEYLTTAIENALRCVDPQDYLYEHVLKRFGLITENEAYHNIHRPHTMEDIKKAKKRFIFDDLYKFATDLKKQRAEICTETDYPMTSATSWNTITKSLPFQLTKDQTDCIKNMYEHIKSGNRLAALLQGDVGSGKTIVAIYLLDLAAENGYQSCIIAPTEILARQHFEEIKNRLSSLPYNIEFLTGSMKTKDKKRVQNAISSGECNIVIGTHAVLQKNVNFKNLGMVVIDEQHRFGVEQREKLLSYEKCPHIVTMSATPIPRTLSMALYGDTIQVYNIFTKPNGRKPIETHRLMNDCDVDKVILHEIHAGHQCYVICPLIDNSDNEKLAELKSVTETYSKIKKDFMNYPEVKSEMISGNMPTDEIAESINRFANNEVNVLVSTTIVEVGVNIPNATVMIIKNSERFGLAQLHQLRGRVGRSNYQSYCILQTKNDDLKANIMCSTSDGFEIAKQDLKMRGPGDYIGTKQSGENKYIMLSIAYPELYKKICNYLDETN